ncbi:MAG: oligosaccharide flippase family protein [Bdellovibrionaceae bacterium]|nr:oligosaccharide flippase family protein [Pseudobdellovibrionaceae bacterium]
MRALKVHSIFKTSSALILGQLFNFLFIPLISRMYSPETFGQSAIFYAVVGIVGGISTARYSDAIVLVRSEGNARAMASLCLSVGLAFSLLSAVLLLIFGRFLELIPLGLYLIPFNVFLMSVHLTVLQLLVRKGRFSSYSLSIFLISTFPSVLQYLGGLLIKPSASVLIAAGFFGQFIAVIVSYLIISEKIRAVSWVKLVALARHYSLFPRFSMGFMFFSLIRVRAIHLILGSRDPFFLGNYAQTERLLSAPGNLVGGAIRPIVHSHAAKVGLVSAAEEMRRLLRLILLMGAPFVGLMMYFSEDVIRLILGDQWGASSPILDRMIVPSFFLLATSWMDRVFDVLKAQQSIFRLELIYGSFAILACVFFVGLRSDSMAAVTVISVAFTIYYMHWAILFFTR